MQGFLRGYSLVRMTIAVEGKRSAHLPPASRTSTWTLLFSVKRFATTLPAVPPKKIAYELIPLVHGVAWPGDAPPTMI